MKKNGVKKVLAFGAASVLSFSFAACNTTASADYAYMAIDINPTVEFVLKDDKVVSVNAVNDDAAVLVSSEDFVGKTAEEVSAAIVQLAEELGYLNDTNTNVKITVATDDEALAKRLEEKAKRGAQSGSEMAKVNCNPRSADNRTVKQLKEENADLYGDLTPAKVRLIETIMRYDQTFTYEAGAAMKLSELADMLEDLVEEFEDLVGDKLKDEFAEKVAQKNYETQLAIATVYGEEYKNAWVQYQALEQAYDLIEKAAENAVILETDVREIMNILGISDVELIAFDGVVTVESVDRYVDRHCDDDFAKSEAEEDALEDMEDAVEDILDKYDEDEYALTEADVLALDTAWGEALGVSVGDTLENVEDIVEAKEDALEALRESITLTEEQEAQIRDLQEQMKAHRQEAHGEMKDRIDEMKDHFSGMKDDRKEMHGSR